MYFLGLGLVLLVMKWASWGPVAEWSWWWVLWPFLAAVLWWWYADASGYTKRKVMEKEAARKEARLQEARDRLKQFRRQ